MEKCQGDEQNQSINSFQKLLNFMERIGKKLKNMQGLEQEPKLDLTLKSSLIELKDNLKLKKEEAIIMVKMKILIFNR